MKIRQRIKIEERIRGQLIVASLIIHNLFLQTKASSVLFLNWCYHNSPKHLGLEQWNQIFALFSLCHSHSISRFVDISSTKSLASSLHFYSHCYYFNSGHYNLTTELLQSSDKNSTLDANKSGFKFWTRHSLAVWLWTHYFTFPSLIWKTDTVNNYL